MGIKEIMLDRIEKDSIKVNVNGDIVYLKKSGFLVKEWRVIYPPVNPETKKWNKMNLIFGGKGNAIKYLAVGLMVVLLAIGVYDIVHSYNITMSNPAVKLCLDNANIKLG